VQKQGSGVQEGWFLIKLCNYRVFFVLLKNVAKTTDKLWLSTEKTKMTFYFCVYLLWITVEQKQKK